MQCNELHLRKALQGRKVVLWEAELTARVAIRACPQPGISVLPLLAPELRASPPTVRAVRVWGLLPFCSQNPDVQTLSNKSCKIILCCGHSLPLSLKGQGWLNPLGVGELFSLCLGRHCQEKRGKWKGRRGSCGCASVQGSSTRCSSWFAAPASHGCLWCPCVPMESSALFSEDVYFVFPAAHPPAIPGCPLPGAEAADMSQGRGTQDALWSLELSLNGKETLIYALSSRKYFFKRHCSYLRCSYTTASHK